ncbi:MAG: phage NrS-1 polymerase family protein [Staphylococcus equorum]
MAITTLDKIIEVNEEEIPEELKQLDKWVLWRAEWIEKQQVYSKVPYSTEGHKASSTNANTWLEFQDVVSLCDSDEQYNGIGFVLSNDDNYICLDIDDAVNPDTGQLQTDLAIEMTELTYCELSPSGTGLHCFFKGVLPDNRKKKRKDLDIELYDSSRFMTVTGHTIGQSEICDEQETINNIVERYFKMEESQNTITYNPNHKSNLSDEEVLNIMLKSKSKDKISDLLKGHFEKHFDSSSEAVQSLLHYLAFYTGKDKVQMERIFTDYNNLTDKWDSKRGSSTWGKLELDKAISNQNEVYKKSSNDFEIVLNEEKIPDGYQLGDNSWLYMLVEKGRGDNKQVVPKLLTSTPPFITHKFRDIESGEFYYQLSFSQNNIPYNMKVTAREIADAQHIIGLATKGFDVTTSNRAPLVDYLAMFMRINNKPIIQVATRLGYIKNKFVSPYEDEQGEGVKLLNLDHGKQKIIDAFHTKGNIDNYANGLFKHIKDKPMVMMMFYGSLGSILVKDFGTDSIIVEQSMRTSKGKTFTERICASVWGWHEDLVMEWNATKTSVERMASFFNAFPLIMDDTRKANYKDLPQIFYQFSGGKSKGRATKERGIDYSEEWKTILLSTGEVSTPDISEKGGVAGRVVTLQDEPFPNTSQDDFNEMYKAFSNNYGLLGKLFIKQYNSNKEKYKLSFESATSYFVDKTEGNEVMARIARSFALLQVAGEILNDIEGFEHDPYIITNKAHTSMMKNNQSIDKPKQMMVGLLDYLDAHRNSIEGDGYDRVTHGDIKAIYKKEGLCVITQTVRDFLGDELNNITGGWAEKNYLNFDKDDRRTKRISHNGSKPRGYMIKNEVIESLGYDFNRSHNPYY